MAKVVGTRLLSDASIRAWLRGGSAAPLHDGGGLYLRKRAGGAYWALRQVNPMTGRRTWAALLPGVAYPGATLQRARDEADKGRLLLAQDTDLVRERESRRAAAKASALAAELEQQRRLTVRQLFDRWRATDLQPHTRTDGKRGGRKDGGEYTAQQFERRLFPRLGAVPAADVTRSDLLAVLDAVKAEGKRRTANVLLADLKQMFQFARARDIVTTNPLDTVSKRDAGGPTTMRDRVLTVEEIAELERRLPGAGMHLRSVAAVWLLLATGARVGELMGAVWADPEPNLSRLAESPLAAGVKVGAVDLDAGTWHIPTTKNQRDHTIQLSDFAKDQFRALLALRPAATDLQGRTRVVPWVFPDSANTGPVCEKSFGKQLADRQRDPARRIPGRSKRTQALTLPGGRWTAHDLRRTAGTLMASLGVSGDVIDECLNHIIESKVRRTYVRDRRIGEQAEAFARLGRLLQRIRASASGGNVVALPAAEAA